jgi:ATP-dependent Clp protease adaptor protein ClpS
MSGTQTVSITDVGIKVTLPRKYKVVMLNDDYTPMEFVIILLVEVFGKSVEEAEQITLQVHNDGKGIAGIYYYELAEQKVYEAIMYARNNGFPLNFSIEEE